MDKNFLQLKDTIQLHGKRLMGFGEMARPGEVSAAKTDDLSLILGTRTMEEGNWLPQALLSPPHVFYGTNMCANRQRRKKEGRDGRTGRRGSLITLW